MSTLSLATERQLRFDLWRTISTYRADFFLTQRKELTVYVCRYGMAGIGSCSNSGSVAGGMHDDSKVAPQESCLLV